MSWERKSKEPEPQTRKRDEINLSFWIWTVKAKRDWGNYIKLRRFFIAKETLDKVTRTPTEWEKIFVNCTIDD